MKKKQMAQSCGAGICEMASGYTTNARPGPEEQTCIQYNGLILCFLLLARMKICLFTNYVNHPPLMCSQNNKLETMMPEIYM